MINLGRHVVSPVVAIRLVFRHGDYLLLVYELVPQFHRQPKVKVEDARLAHVLGLGACLADFGLFEAGVGARLPPENGEWPSTNLAFAPKLHFRHANVGIVAQARFA